jgi:hypothetical protein
MIPPLQALVVVTIEATIKMVFVVRFKVRLRDLLLIASPHQAAR